MTIETFEVIEDDELEFCAMREIWPVCISVEYVDARDVVDSEGALVRSLPAGYLPTLAIDDRGDYEPSRGVPMATKDAAAEAAHSLVDLHTRAMARAFRPFGEGADCIVDVAP